MGEQEKEPSLGQIAFEGAGHHRYRAWKDCEEQDDWERGAQAVYEACKARMLLDICDSQGSDRGFIARQLKAQGAAEERERIAMLHEQEALKLEMGERMGEHLEAARHRQEAEWIRAGGKS